MNLTTLRLDFVRFFRDPSVLFFVMALPALIYLIFGGTSEYRDAPVGDTTVGALLMVNMAIYGALSATTTVASSSAVEKMQGWGRQLGLSGQSNREYALSKALLGGAAAVMPVSLVYIIDAITDGRLSAGEWIACFTITVVGAGLFASFGLMLGLLLRGDAANAVASGSLVLLSFAGNLFTPLSGVLLTIAKFTPFYGLGVLVRYPLSGGVGMQTGSMETVPEDLTVGVINFVVWMLIFFVGCAIAVSRDRNRE
ncbi:hypothetical protein ACU19_01025 [Actinobaculum suis]|uniref:ABC transporter permease n=1 Tax=Actinobaculum suis TaxID=1657 RepID=UPI00066FCECF|nr:ABC transporter permease [Actinobaculum suis]KMY23987.1 hypothetical protein ACU19_01025 [Actinobaculum suis]